MDIERQVNQVLKQTGSEVRRVSAPPATSARPAGRAATKAARRKPHGSRSLTAELPAPVIATGGAVASNFFDDYPLFISTSTTAPHPIRLNLRYEAIFGQNLDLFKGARVLDIASHDGRWSFAALKSGASEVIGIEGRPELVEHANATFDHYGVNAERYRFIAGDIFEVLNDERFEVDIVLCLGFLYHTLRYNELLSHIADCRPRALIIDSAVYAAKDPLVYLQAERVDSERNAIADEYSRGDRVLAGKPTASAIERMVKVYGFDVERYSDWAALLRDNDVDNTVAAYARGQRVTMRCVSRSRRD